MQQQMACPHEAMPVSKLESGTSSQLAPDVRIGSLADGVKTVRHFRPSAGTHEGRFFASIGVIRSYNVACTTTLGAKKTKLVREDLVDAGERYFVA